MVRRRRPSPFVVLPLLGRRRFPFAAPRRSGWWRRGLSFVDGQRRRRRIGVLFAAGHGGGVPARRTSRTRVQGRIGLAVMLGCRGDRRLQRPRPRAPGEFLFTPGLFAIAWLAGFALRERVGAGRGGRGARRPGRARARGERAARGVRGAGADRARAARRRRPPREHDGRPGRRRAARHRPRSRPRRRRRWPRSRRSSRQAVAELHRLLGFLRQAGDARRPGSAARARRSSRGLAASMSDSELAVDGQRRGRAARRCRRRSTSRPTGSCRRR